MASSKGVLMFAFLFVAANVHVVVVVAPVRQPVN